MLVVYMLRSCVTVLIVMKNSVLIFILRKRVDTHDDIKNKEEEEEEEKIDSDQ
jgi:hypothetical protein